MHKLERAAFVLDEAALISNLELISQVSSDSGAEIILALKAYAFWPTFPLIKEFVSSATASSLNEAKLVYEYMKVKPHVYLPAYLPNEIEELSKMASHITFNSILQFEKYATIAMKNGASPGLRVNPLYSPVEVDLYNPSSPIGRLGVNVDVNQGFIEGLEGLHVHALCESTAEHSASLIQAVVDKFGDWLPRLKWLNLGGGHLMTKKGYQTSVLINAIKELKNQFPNLDVILEPGSAFAWQTGDLVAHVLDIVDNGGVKTLMLDVSFTCHMPDTLEMPYRPSVVGASTEKKDAAFAYRLGGTSCLAGDYLESYYFEKEVQIGQQIVFEDMMHYTIVKTTMFNGVQHPDILIRQKNSGNLSLVRRFTFEDYRNLQG